MKTCYKCKERKPLNLFYNGRGKCVSCVSIYLRTKRAKEKLYKRVGLDNIGIIRFSFKKWCEHEGSEFKLYTAEELLCMHSN